MTLSKWRQHIDANTVEIECITPSERPELDSFLLYRTLKGSTAHPIAELPQSRDADRKAGMISLKPSCGPHAHE